MRLASIDSTKFIFKILENKSEKMVEVMNLIFNDTRGSERRR